MELDQPDLKRLKGLKGEEREQKIMEYNERKLLLIEKYIEVQNIVDTYNEQIYELSCQIEQINLILQQLDPKNNPVKKKVQIIEEKS